MKRKNSRSGIKLSHIRVLILNTLEKEHREWWLFVADVCFCLIDTKPGNSKDKYNSLLLSSYELPTLTLNLLNTGTFV